jgi:Eco57I restriction-modification methylase
MTTTAPAGLNASQRSTLERLVIRARSLLENDLAGQAEGRFGIHTDGTIEDEAALPDDTTDKITRRDLEQIVAHLRTQGEGPPDAVARLLREAAFTHLNRLVAIRIAEAVGLLPESLANGPQSRGFKDLGEIMPILAGDYRAYVRLCGDELAADAPALFDPRNPLLALQPSTAVFDNLVALLADHGTAEIWPAPDTLGWAYQFFNTGDERREMREASAPRNSRELAVRNQFFTPRYVVDFLVQNTIGRRLIESDPTSSLLDKLPLLIDPPTERGPALELDEVKCLDPACGSGHFLLGCYDVLEQAWELAGVTPSDSAPMIVGSLWGVDIDARCAQIASAAIVLRARRHCRDLPLPRPNIVTARGLPGGSGVLPPDLQLTAGQRSLIDRVSGVLAGAPLLGTLLKAEEALDQEIRHSVFGGEAGTLNLTDEAAEATERELLNHLGAIADQASSSVVERLLAAEADDALRLVDVVRQRYDAVVMNPPFGEPVVETKPYLRAAYPWLPGRVDLYAAFVGRGLELCNAAGYLGAITSRAGLFISTFEKWRRSVVLGNRLVTLADLGYRVMHQAKVEAAAYVIGAGHPSPGERAVFARILKEPDRAGSLAEAVAASRAGKPDPRIFRVALVDFEAVPGSPVAYWMSPPVRRLFTSFAPLEGNGAEVRVGLQTGDDFRFVRAFWEIDPHRIARSRDETLAGRRWCPFAKGGEYSPYWADIHLVVDYENDGHQLREYAVCDSKPELLFP